MEPTVWGPHVWAALHLICLGAPERLTANNAADYRKFLEGFAGVLPCGSCREHFAKVLAQAPIDNALTGRDALFSWSVRAHNAVNARLGKPEFSVEQARERWSNVKSMGTGVGDSDSDSDSQCKCRPIIFGLVVAIFIMAWLLFSKASRRTK